MPISPAAPAGGSEACSRQWHDDGRSDGASGGDRQREPHPRPWGYMPRARGLSPRGLCTVAQVHFRILARGKHGAGAHHASASSLLP